VRKYDSDEMTEFGEGFKAGIICTALVLFILWLVAFVSYDLGKAASRDAQSKLSEEERT
jgi:Na+-transporting methylmalonyl-CoA/oxaloacetate decarboxylase gamma subunit